jgi:hypothetical protein
MQLNQTLPDYLIATSRRNDPQNHNTKPEKNTACFIGPPQQQLHISRQDAADALQQNASPSGGGRFVAVRANADLAQAIQINGTENTTAVVVRAVQ